MQCQIDVDLKTYLGLRVVCCDTIANETVRGPKTIIKVYYYSNGDLSASHHHFLKISTRDEMRCRMTTSLHWWSPTWEDWAHRVQVTWNVTLTLKWSHCGLTDQNKLGIASFANEFPNQGDLCEFMDIYCSDMDQKVALTRIISVIPVCYGTTCERLLYGYD